MERDRSGSVGCRPRTASAHPSLFNDADRIEVTRLCYVSQVQSMEAFVEEASLRSADVELRCRTHVVACTVQSMALRTVQLHEAFGAVIGVFRLSFLDLQCAWT